MLCEYCKKKDVVEGTLEGVSFEPLRESKKRFASGVYGIKAMACPECGRITNCTLDVEALRKIMRK